MGIPGWGIRRWGIIVGGGAAQEGGNSGVRRLWIHLGSVPNCTCHHCVTFPPQSPRRVESAHPRCVT